MCVVLKVYSILVLSLCSTHMYMYNDFMQSCNMQMQNVKCYTTAKKQTNNKIEVLTNSNFAVTDGDVQFQFSRTSIHVYNHV